MSRENIIVKAGWMYRQKTVFQKRWKKKWMVLFQDGRLSFKNDSTSQKQGKLWDLRRDCMHLWGDKQCRHVLPPPQSSSMCLIDLLFVHNRRLTICALSELEAQHWFLALDRCRNEREISAHVRYNGSLVPIEESDDEAKKGHCACCVCSCSCFSFHNRVREVNYLRPATQGSRRRQKHKRRVSWNDNITMIS